MRSEDGVALVFALFAGLVMAGLVTVFVARAVNESRQNVNSARYEGSIHIAEGGADGVVNILNDELDDAPHVTKDPDGNNHVIDPSDTLAQQRADAIGWALELHAAGAATSTEEGTSVGIRPSDGVNAVPWVFGVGFSPPLPAGVDKLAEIPARTRMRVVKYHIARNRWSPDFAIETGLDLKLGGSAYLKDPDCDTSTPEKKAETCNADVKVNGAMTYTGSNAQIQGQVRVAGGSCPSGAVSNATNGCVDSGDGVQVTEVPNIRARQFYDRTNFVPNPDGEGHDVEWYDLCPDGKIYERSASGPCDTTQTAVWPQGGQTNFKGWTYQSGTKTWKATSIGAGIFYVYRADAEVSGSAGTKPRSVTIFVETDAAQPGLSGALSLSGNPKLQSAFPDVLFVADRDIRMSGTQTAGDPCSSATAGAGYSGFISAYEQIDVGGNVNLQGAMLMQDRDDLHKEVQRNNATISGNMCLNYDETLAIDLTGIYTITHWNELRPGS